MSAYPLLTKILVPVLGLTTLVPPIGCVEESRHIPAFELKDIDGETFQSTQARSPYSLYILFSLDDCPICLFEAEWWQFSFEHFDPKVIHVIAIVHTDASEKIRKFARDYRISFPILLDPEGKVTSAFRRVIPSESRNLPGPIKLLTDSSGGVLYCEPGTKNMDEHRAFFDRISSKIKR